MMDAECAPTPLEEPQIASADTGCAQSRWRYRVSVLGDATEYEEPPLALLASAMM